MERIAISFTSKRITVGHGVLQRFLLCGYFVLSVFESYLNGLWGSLTKYYVFALMFVLIALYQKLKLNAFHCAFLGWLGYKFFSLLWSEDFATPQAHWVSQLGMVAFLCVVIAIDLDQKTLSAIKSTYLVSSGVLGLLALFFSDSYHGVVSSRQVLVILGVETDPNDLAAFLLIGISIALGDLFYEGCHRGMSLIVLAINTTGCFRSGSRGGLVTLLLLLIICFCVGNGKKNIKASIRKIVLVAITIFVVYYIATTYIPKEIFDRLFLFDSYDGGSGRMKMWENVWSFYTQDSISILFGTGWGSATIYTGADVVAHNTFLTMLCDVGLLGTMLFVCPLVYCIYKMFCARQMMPVIVFVAGMCPSFFLDAANKRFFWNAVLFLLVMYKNYKKHSRDEA